MIRIQCIKCQQVLTMDDAFAGGVCRCQHCGAIQTVPGKAKLRSQPADQLPVGQPAPGGSTAANSAQPATPTGSGLDELAEAVASSGLTSSRLRKPTTGEPPPASATPKTSPAKADPEIALHNRLLLLIAIACLAGLAVLVFILVLVLREKPSPKIPLSPPAGWLAPDPDHDPFQGFATSSQPNQRA